MSNERLSDILNEMNSVRSLGDFANELFRKFSERIEAAWKHEVVVLETAEKIHIQNIKEEKGYDPSKFKHYSDTVVVRGKAYFPTKSVCKSCAHHGVDGRGCYCVRGNIPLNTELSVGTDCKDHLCIDGIEKGGCSIYFAS